jgi:hypothetical protein
MRTTRYLICLPLAGLLCLSPANAGVYTGISIGRFDIDTPAASTHPTGAAFYLGYSLPPLHQFELVYMTGRKDDGLNQLTTGVDSVSSVFYRFLLDPSTHLKMHLILGASDIDVKSKYQGSADAVSNFSGFSYGLSFKEAFQSIPNLSLSFEWIRLYHGDNMDINTMNLGLVYEF